MAAPTLFCKRSYMYHKSKKDLSTSETMLFQIEEMCWDEIEEEADDLITLSWTIYRNGLVRSWVEYSLNGRFDLPQFKMSKAGFCSLCKMLKSFEQTEDNFDCYDGTGYEMILYGDRENVLHQFSGYIYGSKYLKQLASLIYREAGISPHDFPF